MSDNHPHPFRRNWYASPVCADCGRPKYEHHRYPTTSAGTLQRARSELRVAVYDLDYQTDETEPEAIPRAIAHAEEAVRLLREISDPPTTEHEHRDPVPCPYPGCALDFGHRPTSGATSHGWNAPDWAPTPERPPEPCPRCGAHHLVGHEAEEDLLHGFRGTLYGRMGPGPSHDRESAAERRFGPDMPHRDDR